MTLGEKIYRLRTEKSLSQEEFGEHIGVSRQSVSKWETGQAVPELEKIVAISNFFGVSTDYLLKEEKEESETEDKTVVRTIEYHYWKPHYEYKSRKMVRGLPLVHINIGSGVYRAKGIIAIGMIAQGGVAFGLVSAGGLSFGVISMGLIAAGSFAAGLFAAGAFALGVIAVGAIAYGIFSLGAVAIGQFAFGASAHGAQVAIGDVARGNIALGYSQAAGKYTQVSGRKPFDYESACRVIDELVSSKWLFFKTWAKVMIKLF